ncbi:MAG: hypothetical protein Q8935_10065 [Bacillota bacterium]|nr:hypothetical protein [Bacillota bacterium]
MKWTNETITIGIKELMKKLNIDRMPTNTEMRENSMSGLSRAIILTGGMDCWINKLNLKAKEKERLWNDERIEQELKHCISVLQLDRMPTANELHQIGRNDLHCALSKHSKKYRGWARELGLELKESETTKGNKFEFYVMKKIQEISNHLSVEKMTTKHPYDLLVNGCVKVDVKVGKAHYHFGPRAHTFALNKKFATCDIYICVALDEDDKIEKFFIIPAAKVQIVTLNICENSKYNKYKNDWNFLYNFVNQYERAIAQ